MSFKSFLSAVGHDFENGLNLVLGDVSKIATIEAPILATLNPQAGALASQIAALSTQAYGIVVQTEQKFAALGKASGTGVQKAAEAITILTPAVAQVLGLAGQRLSTSVSAFIEGAVGILNALPANLAGPAPAPTSAAAPTSASSLPAAA
ncbi:MAG TPA: hypothetical protein VGM27_01745 [Acidobacteriaceae bacterium]|jgi:hypothetical protein